MHKKGIPTKYDVKSARCTYKTRHGCEADGSSNAPNIYVYVYRRAKHKASRRPQKTLPIYTSISVVDFSPAARLVAHGQISHKILIKVSSSFQNNFIRSAGCSLVSARRVSPSAYPIFTLMSNEMRIVWIYERKNVFLLWLGPRRCRAIQIQWDFFVFSYYYYIFRFRLCCSVSWHQHQKPKNTVNGNMPLL